MQERRGGGMEKRREIEIRERERERERSEDIGFQETQNRFLGGLRLVNYSISA